MVAYISTVNRIGGLFFNFKMALVACFRAHEKCHLWKNILLNIAQGPGTLMLMALPGKLAVAIYIDNEIIEWRMIFHFLMVLTK